MHVPADKSLASWIRELEAEGRIYRFYKTDEWQALRAKVLRDAHYECADCKEKGRYSKAKLVHHVHEVLEHPSLALKEYARDPKGNIVRNLVPLCHDCHESRHKRVYAGHSISDEKLREINERFPERW